MASLLPVVLFLSIIVTTFNYGFFSFAGLGVVLTIYLLLLIFFFNRDQSYFSDKSKIFTFSFLFIVSYTLLLFFSGGIYQQKLIPSYLILFLSIISFPLVLTYAFSYNFLSFRERKIRFYYFILLSFFLRILIIIASPEPIIDVFTIQKEAPQILLSGKNPYEAVYSQVYQGVKTDYYSYWPVSFLAQIPFVLLFKDPRVLFAFADVAAGVLLYLWRKNSIEVQALSLIYLYRPNSIFIIEQSWLDPLAVFLFFLIYYLWQKSKVSLYALGALIGFLLGLKLYYILAVPFFLLLFYKKNGLTAIWKSSIGFVFTLLSTVAPFFFWNKEKFIQNTFLDFLFKETRPMIIPIHRSLNLNTLYYIFTNRDIPISVVVFILASIYLLLVYKLLTKKKTSYMNSYVVQIIISQVLVFFSLFIFFQYAFINYYYFATGLIILWLVIRESGKKKQI